ncbi:MAG: hypothetical protein FWC89_10885 [Defluviitaleaceae bacterium]|nr:hypothetical protein [Defluviitaleaceae bacterium]
MTDTRLEKLKMKHESLLKKAKKVEAEANEIAKLIEEHEQKVVFRIVCQTAKTVDGGMDEVLEILKNLRTNDASSLEKTSTDTASSKIKESEVVPNGDVKNVSA